MSEHLHLVLYLFRPTSLYCVLDVISLYQLVFYHYSNEKLRALKKIHLLVFIYFYLKRRHYGQGSNSSNLIETLKTKAENNTQ